MLTPHIQASCIKSSLRLHMLESNPKSSNAAHTPQRVSIPARLQLQCRSSHASKPSHVSSPATRPRGCLPHTSNFLLRSRACVFQCIFFLSLITQKAYNKLLSFFLKKLEFFFLSVDYVLSSPTPPASFFFLQHWHLQRTALLQLIWQSLNQGPSEFCSAIIVPLRSRMTNQFPVSAARKFLTENCGNKHCNICCGSSCF